jgi:hypothetical protein
MKSTLKKVAALTLTLVFAFGINVGLNSAMESDVLDFLFSNSSSTTIEQSEIYASGNTMLPPAYPRPRDQDKTQEVE